MSFFHILFWFSLNFISRRNQPFVSKNHVLFSGLTTYLGQIKGKDELFFFYEDHLGSIRHITDYYGNITGEAEYSPFGVPVKRINSVSFGFCGEEQDETGKVYLRARYYEPGIARFISKDPKRLQFWEETQQHRYAYAVNSPTNYFDRDGEQSNEYIYDKFRIIQKNDDFLLYKYNQYNRPFVKKTVLNLFYNKCMEQSHTIPNYFGFQKKNNFPVFNRYFETSIVSEFYYKRIPALSYISLHHDVTMNSLSHTPFKSLSNFTTMPTEAIKGASHLGFDLIFPGNKYSSNYKQLLDDRSGTHPLIDKSAISSSNQNITPDFISEQRIKNQLESSFNTNTDYNNPSAFTLRGDPIKTFSTPNVGGVYLDKAAELIGDLSNIEGVTFDPVTNRVILFGGDKKNMKAPPFRLDDLATAFRVIYGNYKKDPGVTIDPDPKNPRADKMLVKFFGGVENTHFGYVLFEADRIMKALSLGKDNITKKSVSVNVKGYYNSIELSFSNLVKTHSKTLWSRFWIVPEQIIVKVSNDKKTITFPDTKIRIKTETMKWENGALVPAGGDKDNRAESFASHFTVYYDKYAKELPIFTEVKRLANIVAFAKWLKDSGYNVDLNWLEEYEKFFDTPQKTPSLSLSEERLFSNGDKTERRKASIFGGVDFSIKEGKNFIYIKDDGKSSRIGKKVIRALNKSKPLPTITSRSFISSNGKMKRLIALPTSKTRAAGAIMIKESELELIDRVYCSFHNEKSSFGRTWKLNLPKLRLIKKDHNKIQYKKRGNKKIVLRKYRFTSPFGRMDVTFDKIQFDSQNDNYAFLPAGKSNFRVLYPDDDKGIYRLEYKSGISDYFNKKGLLEKRSFSTNLFQVYKYDNTGKLQSTRIIQNKEILKKLKLHYDKNSRIKSATTQSGKIRYYYDTGNNLTKVTKKIDTIAYGYYKNHLIKNIDINNKKIASFKYDNFGRVLSVRGTEDYKFSQKIETLKGKIKITSFDKKNKVISVKVYGAGGRLLKHIEPKKDETKFSYNRIGEIKKIESTNKFKDLNKLEIKYFSDGKKIKYTNAVGSVRAFLLDSFGRIRQIQNKESSLINIDFGLTEEGWSEIITTSDMKIQSLYKNMKPANQIIKSLELNGGGVGINYGYNGSGGINKMAIKGLINKKLIFKDNKLHEIFSNNTKTRFSYNNSDRIEEIVSGEKKVLLEYDKNGFIESFESTNGDFEEEYTFNNGLLVARKNSQKLSDLFIYDKHNKLTGIKRADKEKWEIKYSKNIIAYIRNGVKQMEMVIDDKGQLISYYR